MTAYADMPAGAEMNALVATKVMRWHVASKPSGKPTFDPAEAWTPIGWYTAATPTVFRAHADFSPSVNISHALEVVEMLCDQRRSRFDLRSDGLSNYAAIFDGLAGTADTAPLAICRAALRAVGR